MFGGWEEGSLEGGDGDWVRGGDDDDDLDCCCVAIMYDCMDVLMFCLLSGWLSRVDICDPCLCFANINARFEYGIELQSNYTALFPLTGLVFMLNSLRTLL